MYTIHELCEKSNLSRSTLLYYDSIGLLIPVSRNEANYRLYSEDSLKSLERICTYRSAGVPLDEIKQILSFGETVERSILEETLELLNSEADKIKRKQEKIASMLRTGEKISDTIKGVDRDLIISSLKLIGVDNDALIKFHAHLEKASPDEHQTFLEVLGFSRNEIEQLRNTISKTN